MTVVISFLSRYQRLELAAHLVHLVRYLRPARTSASVSHFFFIINFFFCPDVVLVLSGEMDDERCVLVRSREHGSRTLYVFQTPATRVPGRLVETSVGVRQEPESPKFW